MTGSFFVVVERIARFLSQKKSPSPVFQERGM
jgi:hypothetical protein